MIWVIGQPEGATHTQQYSDIQTNTIYSQKHDFQENWKDKLRIESRYIIF